MKREEIAYVCPECGHKNTIVYDENNEVISSNYCDCDDYDEEAGLV